MASSSSSSPAGRSPSPAAILEDAQRFRKLAANLPGVIYSYVLRPNGTHAFTYLSDNLRELYELEPAAALRDPELIWSCLHPDDLNYVTDAVATSAQHLTRWQVEWRILTPSGQLKWVASLAQPEQQADGSIVWDGVFLDISDRKQAEAQQRQSEQFYHSLARNLPNGIAFIFDRDCRYTLVEGTAELTALGLSPAALEGQTPSQALPEEFAQPLLAIYQRVLAGEAVVQELALGDRTYLLSCAPLRDSNNVAIAGLSVAQNISKFKATEAALREREQFLRTIYDGIERPLFAIAVCADREFRYLSWNPMTEQITGISAAAAAGKTPVELLGLDTGRQIEHRLQHCLDVGAAVTHEECFQFGSERSWWSTTYTPLRDESGHFYQIIGSSNNISDRKAAEIALQQKAEREALFNHLASQIRHSLDLNTILNTAAREIRDLLAIDRACVAWYGEDETGAYWQVSQESKRSALPSLAGRYAASQLQPLAQQAQSGQTIRIDDLTQTPASPLRDFLSSQGYRSYLAVPLATATGRLGIWSAGHCHGERPWQDSEVELMETLASQIESALNQGELYEQSRLKSQELEQAYRELQQTQTQLIQSEKMSSLGQLVAGVAHEINNPVNFISGNINHASDYLADLMQVLNAYERAYPQPAPDIAKAIADIDLQFVLSDLPKLFDSMHLGAERIKEIVKSLRTFSRLDEAEMKAIDLHESLDSTLMILHSRLKAKAPRAEIAIVKRYGDLPPVDCYAGQLNQVFMNLISNAIDALEERDAKCSPEAIAAEPSQIAIATKTVDNKVRIEIADNGVGIPAETVSRIFDPFFTTKPVGKGTGLGLSISYQIVTEKHRGRLSCQSQPGKGTRFAIEIPQRQPELT